ncbi:hypothetical protein NDU88_002451 [Pleurodeles waltl]|uniref:Uncharacterized protein n=1 Tax=Pleurodeles waltl TaxID=8319 RepID=A0AAV7W1X0_PLEWA|nr:hypothetical protein NDU88_002451 [Pleurodeles waltl]
MQGRRSRPKNDLNGRSSYLCFWAKITHSWEADTENDAQPDLHKQLTAGPRLGRMSEEELVGFIWLVCHFLLLMIEAGGKVIQGYQTEARRIRWGKVLHQLQRVYASQRSDRQLKHRWADLITREQDLLDHLGIVIGGTVGEY